MLNSPIVIAPVLHSLVRRGKAACQPWRSRGLSICNRHSPGMEDVAALGSRVALLLAMTKEKVINPPQFAIRNCYGLIDTQSAEVIV